MNTTQNLTHQDIEADMARWDLPADTSLAAATAATALGYDRVCVPFFLPGKIDGIWTFGQEVEVGDVFFFMDNKCDGVDQRYACGRHARTEMAGDRGGVVGYFMVWADTTDHHATTAAFEDPIA